MEEGGLSLISQKKSTIIKKNHKIIHSVFIIRTFYFSLYPIQLENPFEVTQKTKKHEQTFRQRLF